MEKILYIDCFSGISGDMMLGALIDLGVDFNFLKEELKKIKIEGCEIECIKVKKSGIAASKFEVKVTGSQTHRSYTDIQELINKSTLNHRSKEIALAIFETIASAESIVHIMEKGSVHFHEIGAVDSIIDIVGTAILIAKLAPDKVISSDIPLGRGFIHTMHGMLPVPAPATLEILKNLPVYTGDFDFEVTTPTGAAIVKTLASGFGGIPIMKIKSIGFGSGSIEVKGMPNLLRIISGELCEVNKNETGSDAFGEFETEHEDMILLSANIDDLSAEIIGFILGKLFEAKVPDAWTEPVFMKKNRQAIKISILCRPEEVKIALDILFKESSTLGVRSQSVKRYQLKREVKTINLSYGEVEVKIGYYKGEISSVSPEYESCRKLALKTGRPLKEIYRDATCSFSTRIFIDGIG
ncbi:MAG: nickel pincer cofactor biosynthesis protein LarC [Actinobacteria bacterium]|nr:nickel pincer cofactor biosynthesis protein LarC [Actinomycetota bacterium]